jgi:hypothetical protein
MQPAVLDGIPEEELEVVFDARAPSFLTRLAASVRGRGATPSLHLPVGYREGLCLEREVVFRRGEFLRAVLASMAIP